MKRVTRCTPAKLGVHLSSFIKVQPVPGGAALQQRKEGNSSGCTGTPTPPSSRFLPLWKILEGLSRTVPLGGNSEGRYRSWEPRRREWGHRGEAQAAKGERAPPDLAESAEPGRAPLGAGRGGPG